MHYEYDIQNEGHTSSKQFESQISSININDSYGIKAP